LTAVNFFSCARIPTIASPDIILQPKTTYKLFLEEP
jgi:hypothetical protein